MDDEIYIDKVDHTNKKVDYAALPEDICKLELQNSGIRCCTLNKKKLALFVEDIWIYKKNGEIPDRFAEESDDEDLSEA